jgi:hypothetical protein
MSFLTAFIDTKVLLGNKNCCKIRSSDAHGSLPWLANFGQRAGNGCGGGTWVVNFCQRVGGGCGGGTVPVVWQGRRQEPDFVARSRRLLCCKGNPVDMASCGRLLGIAYFCQRAGDGRGDGTVPAVWPRLPGCCYLLGGCNDGELRHLQSRPHGKHGASMPPWGFWKSLRSKPLHLKPLCSPITRGWKQAGTAGKNINSFLAAWKD